MEHRYATSCGGQLHERFTELPHLRTEPTLATVTSLSYLHSLHTMVTETASPHAEPFCNSADPSTPCRNRFKNHQNKGKNAICTYASCSSSPLSVGMSKKADWER